MVGRESHRNLLLPCPNLVDEQSATQLKERKTDQRKMNKQKEETRIHTRTEDSDSLSEDEYTVWMPQLTQETSLRTQPQVSEPRAKQSARAKQYLRVDTETETPGQNERSLVQEEKEPAQDESQANETMLEVMQQDSEPEGQDPDSESQEDVSEDDPGVEEPRRSTRRRQPRVMYTYDNLGQPTYTVKR